MTLGEQSAVVVDNDAKELFSSGIDAVDNTSSTSYGRVFFGPITSPEKRLVSLQEDATPEPFMMSLRRSPRLSLPDASRNTSDEQQEIEEPEQVEEESNEVQAVDTSRGQTPENEHSPFEEPTSILASRILRAHDNPSPPPLSPLYPTIHLISDHSESLLPWNKHGNIELHGNLNSFSSTVPRSPSPLGKPSIMAMLREQPEPDLLHSDVEPSTPKLIVDEQARALNSPNAFLNQVGETLDNHISTSSDLNSSTTNPSYDIVTTTEGKSPTPESVDSAEEKSVINVLTIPDSEVISSCPPIPDNECRKTSSSPQDGEQSPRRSARARRSTTFGVLPLVAPPVINEEPPLIHSPSRKRKRISGGGNSTKRSTDSPVRISSSSIDRSRRSPQKQSSPGKPVNSASPAKRRDTSPSRRRVLDSLSPSSHSVLSNIKLVMSSSSKILYGAASNITSEADPNAGPSTPARISIPNRSVSPVRFTFSHPALGNMSPARRVPIQTLAEKSRTSPNKPGSGRGLVLNDGRPLNSASKMPFIVPPTDTPRRVPIATTSRNVVTPALQRKDIIPGSPSRSPAKERSRSVEPASKSAANGKGKRSESVEPASSSKASIFPPIYTPKNSSTALKLPFSLTPSSNTEEPEPSSSRRIVPPRSPMPSSVPRSTLKQATSKIPRRTTPYAHSAATSRPHPGPHDRSSSPQKPISTASKVVDFRRTTPLRTTTEPTSTPLSDKPSIPSRILGDVPVIPTLQVQKEVESKNAINDTPSSPPKSIKGLSDQDPENRENTPPDSSIPILISRLISPPPPPEDNAPITFINPDTSAVRRTTRLRKAIRPVASSSKSEPKPTIRRRPPQPHISDSGPFSQMTATALRALTTLNTEKNQHYVAANITTEIVRKDGVRPESPIMKVKSISDRDKEGQRHKRAERRAKIRGVEMMMEEEEVNEEIDVDSPTPRHRRGPGDDEEYVTPQRPMKRLRLDDSLSDDGTEVGKRVKWDYDLSTTVFLDELEFRADAKRKDLIVAKGCLAPAAKALSLDTLGNLSGAELPLQSLALENVVVKKFVYDNDEEVLPLVPAVKNITRSKKKSKSS